MITKVVVCLDGSELAEQVIPYAADIARRFSGKLVLLQVIGMEGVPPIAGAPEMAVSGYTSEMVLEYEEIEEMRSREYLESVAERLSNEGVDVEWATPHGTSAAGTIIDYSLEHGVDLIAIATHGRTGLDRAVFGSVADRVIRESSRPILVIRPKKPEDEEVA